MTFCPPPTAVVDLLQGSSQDYLSRASKLVSQYKGKSYKLRHPAGAKWTIGGLENTIYREKPEVVNGWGKFYLSQEVRMQVVGVVEGTSCPSGRLVLMICETGEMYAYADGELHRVASSPGQLCEEGMEFPSSKHYYEGEAFKDMTKDDWDEVKKGEVGRRLDAEHRKLVASKKAKFLKNLQ